jgi:homoserine dehydrogenase
MFYGAGAGGQPTASAVLGDTVTVARNLLAGLRGPDSSTYAGLPVVPIGDAITRYYVQLDVADRPGVLAPVADVFAQNGVSIKDVRQDGRGEDANLIIMTHSAREAALARTVSALSAMEAVRNVDSVMRVEGLESE